MNLILHKTFHNVFKALTIYNFDMSASFINNELTYWVSEKNYSFGLWNKRINITPPVSRTEALISVKGQFRCENLLGKISRLKDPKFGEGPLEACMGTRIPSSILVHALLAIEIRITHVFACFLPLLVPIVTALFNG